MLQRGGGVSEASRAGQKDAEGELKGSIQAADVRVRRAERARMEVVGSIALCC